MWYNGQLKKAMKRGEMERLFLALLIIGLLAGCQPKDNWTYDISTPQADNFTIDNLTVLLGSNSLVNGNNLMAENISTSGYLTTWSGNVSMVTENITTPLIKSVLSENSTGTYINGQKADLYCDGILNWLYVDYNDIEVDNMTGNYLIYCDMAFNENEPIWDKVFNPTHVEEGFGGLFYAHTIPSTFYRDTTYKVWGIDYNNPTPRPLHSQVFAFEEIK